MAFLAITLTQYEKLYIFDWISAIPATPSTPVLIRTLDTLSYLQIFAAVSSAFPDNILPFGISENGHRKLTPWTM